MPTTLDVSGLSAEQIQRLQAEITAMRAQASVTIGQQQNQLTPEEWVKSWIAWGKSHKPVHSYVDASRDSIYE